MTWAEQLYRHRLRFVRCVQYRLGVGVDGIPGDRETWPAWVARKAALGLQERDYRLVEGDRWAKFVKDVQAAIGVKPDGEPLAKTWAAWVRHAYPEAIAAGAQPLPRYHGAAPVMSSGFNGPLNLGPEFSRWYDLEAGLWGHIGGDYEYRWDGRGEPPKGWLEYHFGYRPERLFYGPPVHVFAMWPGVVKDSRKLPVSVKYGGPRWSVKVYHGIVGELGHVSTQSIHHERVLVEVGDHVDADTPVAIMGDTGSRGAPHNHHQGVRWREGEDKAAAWDMWPIVRQMRLVECNA